MARTVAKDHAEKRLAILQTAAVFFAANGYDRSSMNQLAEACGVSKALIYHYYSGKDALLFDIVETHLTDLRDQLTGVDQSGADKPDILRTLIRTILLSYRDADAKHKVQTEAMTSLPDDQRAVLADLQRQIVAVLTTALEAAGPEVFARHPEKLKPAVMSLFGMVNWFYMWHRPGKGIGREDYADLVTDLALNGIQGL
jgi:AcrR family transcriptional regulator